jgi:hypothetical protein
MSSVYDTTSAMSFEERKIKSLLMNTLNGCMRITTEIEPDNERLLMQKQCKISH